MELGVANCVLASLVERSIDMFGECLWCSGRRLLDPDGGLESSDTFVDGKEKGASVGESISQIGIVYVSLSYRLACAGTRAAKAVGQCHIVVALDVGDEHLQLTTFTKEAHNSSLMHPELALSVLFEVTVTVDDVSMDGRCYFGCLESMEEALRGGGDDWAFRELFEHGAATLPDVRSCDNLERSDG